MKNSKLKSIYQKEVKRITKIIKEKYKPEKIILFGSAATDKITEDSDIDLTIIKKTKKPRLERMRKVSHFLLDRKLPLDILVYTPEEFKERLEMGDFFVEEILEEGKVLYEK